MTKAIELARVVDNQCHLHLHEQLPIMGPSEVDVIVLFAARTDIDESEWLKAKVVNPAFDFLTDPSEEIYTLVDGDPFHRGR